MSRPLQPAPRALHESRKHTAMHRMNILAAGALAAFLAVPAHAQKRVDFLEFSKSWGKVVADFDRDGHDDLFITGHDSDDRVWYWTPTGYQPGAQSLPWVDRHDCDAADVNGDGLLDMYCAIGAVRGTGLKVNELWLQQANGVFAAATNFGAEDASGRGRHPLFMDLNHDGIPDLYLANEAGVRTDHLPNYNHMYLNSRGATPFAEVVTIATGDIGYGCVAKGDINGDGWDDLLVCGTQSAGHLFVNNHRDNFTELSSPAIGTGWAFAKLVDMNGDGKDDLVALTANSHLQIWLNTGVAPYYATAATFDSPLPGKGTGFAVGDFNGDGTKDIYVVLADPACKTAGPDLAPDVMFKGVAGSWVASKFKQAFGGCGHLAATVDGSKVLLENGTPGLKGPNYVIDFGN
jgi:hypothetical protein